MDRDNLAMLFMIMFGILGIIIYGFFYCSDIKYGHTKCYDRNSNEIIGLTCEKEVMSPEVIVSLWLTFIPSSVFGFLACWWAYKDD